MENGAIMRQFHMSKAEARQLANDIIRLIDALDAPTPEVLSVISK